MQAVSLRRWCAVAVLAGAGAAQASTITPGFTFAVASSASDQSSGTHFHSNTGGAFGNPAGKAEVGRYFGEEVRGLSEYDLTGLATSTSAFVTFNVFKAGGLFAGENDFPFTGTIKIVSYLGNNQENIADYQAAATGAVGSFSTSGLVVGNTLSFDITTIFNAAIANGDVSLGIRLAADPLNDRGAWTFDSFRLTTDDQTTVIPVPAALPLLLSGLFALGALARRRSGA